MCIVACVCAHAHRGRRTNSAIIPQAWLTWLFSQGLSLTHSPVQVGWLAREPRILWSPPPSSGITHAHSHTCLLTWIRGLLELRSSGLQYREPPPQPTPKISHCVFLVARAIQSSYQHTDFQTDKRSEPISSMSQFSRNPSFEKYQLDHFVAI